MTDGFFMYKYKTRWCPVGVQHDWHSCVYAHNYQDARRPVSIGYGARLCPYWSKKDTGTGYSQRCPLGLRCPYSHGAKEQLYHPHYFKTVVCRDLRGKACPRQRLCAFFHHRQERRMSPPDDVDYSQPLKIESLPSDWITEFLAPPFLPEASKGPEENGGHRGDGGGHNGNNGNNGIIPYSPQMVQSQGQYGQQMPCVFLLPMNAMGGMGYECSATTESPNGMQSPSNGVSSPTFMQSPNGMMQAAPNWVLVPMEGHAGPMC